MSKALKSSSIQKQKLYVKYLKQKTAESEKTYKDYKNLFNQLIKKKQTKNFYMKKKSKCRGNTKRSWQVMKEITGKVKQKNNTFPKALKINKKPLHSAGQIANEFNPFFTNVGPSLAKNIPPVSTSFTEYLMSFNDVISDSDLTTEGFETAIKSLKPNKAAGIDIINSNTVLDTSDEIKDILFLIFKTSLQQGTFPNKLKIAKVTPLFKSGDAENVTNYRPISVFPIFSKILERIMNNRIYKHLKNNNLLFDTQFRFQLNNSKEHAILQLINDISRSFERGEYT